MATAIESADLQRYRNFRPTPFDGRGLAGDEHGISDWLVCPVSQTRDSGTLARSNFRSFVRALGGESDDVQIHRFGHWGPGWYEIVLVRPDSSAHETAAEMACALEDYPIVDESDYSELESETAFENWQAMSIADRVYALQKYDVCIFAARHDDDIPEDRTGELVSYLAGDI